MTEINNKEEHTMKKRFFSLLMAFCLMLSLVPSALAAERQPDTIVGPNGKVYEIPDVTIADDSVPATANGRTAINMNTVSATYGGTGTATDPYTVSSAQALWDLAVDKFSSSTIRYSYVEITDDIDLSQDDSLWPAEWDGYFKYFYGKLYGATVTKPVKNADGATGTETRPAKITGLPSNCFLIYGWCGGSIENLTIDPNGEAGILTFYPCSVGGKYLGFTAKNITVRSNEKINLTGDDQANYCPLIYSTGGNFLMEDCTVDVDISGNTYGSLFYGYYPIDPSESVCTFRRCVNEGTLNLRHAGMFFGNNSAFTGNKADYFAIENGKIIFDDCDNRGFIYGTDSASIFSARPSGDPDNISDYYDATFGPDSDKVRVPEESCEIKSLTLDMELRQGQDGSLTIMPNHAALPDGVEIGSYSVSVYTYLGWYLKTETGEYLQDGCNRYGAKEIIPASEVATEGTQATLKAYGVCDFPVSTEGLTIQDTTIGNLDWVSYNGTYYYWVDPKIPAVSGDLDWYYFVGKPGNPSIEPTPDIVKLSAYDTNGVWLGSVDATLTSK